MEIKAPDLGVDSAEVSEIMVQVGDVIAKDDNIVLLESDKASVEVPSSAAGKITKINIAIGDHVSEGMVLIELESEATEDTDAKDADNVSEQAPVEQSVASEENVVAVNQNDNVSSEASTSKPAQTASATTHALPDLGVDEAQVAEIMVSV